MSKNDGHTRRSGKSQEPAFIPDSTISQIFGLLEILKSKGGQEDIYKLANELKMEFGETLGVIKAAEILKLVHTPGGDVVLEPLGVKVTEAKINDKKLVIKNQIKTIDVFKKVADFLTEKEGKEATKDEVLEKMAELIPNEDVELTFKRLVGWGRYAEFFGYNDDTETVYLDTGGN